MATSSLTRRVTARGSRLRRAGEATIAATIVEPPSTRSLAALAGIARQLEIRADLAGDLDPDVLREAFDGSLTYALRSADEGGGCNVGPRERHERLAAAASRYDVVDLEQDRDLTPELLALIPPSRRRISWHGGPAGLHALRDRLARMDEIGARLFLLAPAAVEAAGGIAPLRLLDEAGRTDVTAFATGVHGTWSRLLAPRLGAPVVYGAHTRAATAGQPAVERLVADFGLPAMSGLRNLYGIAGASVERSLAPRIYNHGFRALGLPALCLPFSTADFGAFWREVVTAGLPSLGIAPRALTVITPHKEAALGVADLATPRAREAGAANSLVRAGGAWQAATTTRLAGPLAAAGIGVAGRSAAVVGCGGAGRAVAAELRRLGAEVTLVNRGVPRGAYASDLLGMPWRGLADFSPAGYDLVVNATPLAADPPFDPSAVGPGAVVADLVYSLGAETALVAAARARGLATLDGRQVLRAETAGQFELMTGQPMPPDPLGLAP